MILFYLLIWVLPLVQHPIWGRKVGPLTVFEYIGILCLLYAAFRVATRGKMPPIFRTWEVRLFFLLYIIALFSAMTRGQGLSLADSSFISYTSSLLLFIIAISIVDKLERLRWAILAFIGSYAFGSLYVIREWQVGRHYYANFRPGWIVGDANFFSAPAIFAIVLAFYFMQGRRPRGERLYCAGCLLVTLFGVMVCASRGGFLGLAVAFLVIIWRTRNRIRNFALAAVLVLPLSIALPVSPLHRLLNPNSGGKESVQFHLQAWQAGFKMMHRYPFAGVGLGNFKPLMPLYAPAGTQIDTLAHNMFIEMAAELGILTGILFLTLFISTYFTLGRLRKRAGPLLVREAATAFQAGVLGFTVAGCFVSAEYQKTTWMAFALIACLYPLARPKREAAAAQEMIIAQQERDEVSIET